MEDPCRIGRDKVCCRLVCVLQLFPVCAAEEVLNHFRDRFIAAVDANAIVFELSHEYIISDGVLHHIKMIFDRTQQNQILHDCLRRMCTEEALRRFCEIIIAVQGNPKMEALGRDMKSMLESKCCVLVCTYVCMCVGL